MNYDTTSKNTVAHSTFEHLEHHNISKIVILPHKSHVSHKYKCMNDGFFINQHADQKKKSAQNTILCREWLLQKLTFRHSEITIFNHSHNPTQRTFGEPQAPSVFIYIRIHIHVERYIFTVHIQCTVYTHLAKSCRDVHVLTSVDVPCPMHWPQWPGHSWLEHIPGGETITESHALFFLTKQ